MDNLDATQIIGTEVAANDGFVTIVDSSDAMILQAGEANLQPVDDDLWNWVANLQPEECRLEDFNIPTHQKPQELGNNASQLPQEEIGHGTSSESPWAQFVKPNAPKHDTLSPELRSLISWKSENDASKGEAAAKTVQAPTMPNNDITIINPPVAGETWRMDRKRKAIVVDVDENYEKNARGSLSINDKIMALQAMVPGCQKADMATTLGKTVEYLSQAKVREQILQAELKQLRQAMNAMYQSVQNYKRSSLGTPLNMGVHTQLGGMGFRPPVQPSMNLFNSSMSARMNVPQNSTTAPSRLFVPPQVPAPSQQQRIGRAQLQQQRIGRDQVLQDELFVLNGIMMNDVFTQANITGAGDTDIPFKIQPQIDDTQGTT